VLDRFPAPRSTRRPLLATLVGLVALGVGGCTTTDGAETGDPSPMASSPAGAPGTSASVEAPRTIPTSAFFEMPADMRREPRSQADGAAAVPKLCDGELAAGAGVIASAAMMTNYKRPQDPPENVPHGVLYQTIRSYDGDSAATFMQRLRTGLADCQSYQDNGFTVRVRTAPLAGVGDEAVTIDLVRPQTDLPGNPVGGQQTNRIVVIRIGNVVTLLYDAEYERTSSIPALVETFVREATEAIRAWRE